MNRESASLVSGFLASVERCPSRPALEVEGRSFTYRELLDAASSLAAALDGHSTGPEPPLTAVFASRTPTAFFGVVAALLRGHGYVPLNRAYPPDRTAYMLAQTGCRSMIVDAESSRQLPEVLTGIDGALTILVPDLESVDALREALPRHRLLGAADARRGEPYAPKEPDPESIAYLIFTSGSTGAPKGVMVAHRNIKALLAFLDERFGITENDRLSQMYAITFDPSVLDMFLSWDGGACCCCPSQKALLNPGSFIRKHRITVWNSVPSTALFMKRLGSLKASNFPSLRLSIFGGEPLPETVVHDWVEAAPHSEIENLYGPTELAIVGTYYRWDPERSPAECYRGTVPIGRPVPSLTALVCDENLEEVAAGAEGELLMAGAQVTLGYLKDPEKTRRAFVVPPGKSETYYRTGDLVRKPAPGGPIHYLGRIDFQLKILGNRVELGEVEAAIREEAGIEGVVAVGWPPTVSGADGIEAFIEGAPVDAAALKKRLAERLPEYMIPKKFHSIERLPLTENGKHDRRALRKILEETS